MNKEVTLGLCAAVNDRRLEDLGSYLAAGVIDHNQIIYGEPDEPGAAFGVHPRVPRPTGRSFEIEQIWIFTVAAGKITELRGVSDRLGLFLQLGWDWPTSD